jgi:malonyl-CoA O-methyltransferase
MFIPEEYSTRKNPSAVHVSVPSKHRIARSFDLKAAAYDDHAAIQAGLIKQLVGKLADIDQPGSRWIDLGCGTGILAQECRKAGISSRIVNIDHAFNPLCIARERNTAFCVNIQADIDDLPFKKELFDAAIAASTIQWLDNTSDTLHKIAALVRPGGWVAFSVFVEGSFRELFSVQRQFGIPTPVQCIETVRFVHLLEDAGFEGVKYDAANRTAYAPAAAVLLKNISATGGTATAGPLLNRKELAEFCRIYENSFRNGNGVPLTYRAIVGVSRKRPRS